MPRSLLWLAALVACAGGPPAATQANTAPQVVAPDSTARRLLATLDPAIAQEVGYATPRNFTGEPLPGYGVGIALLRREAADSLRRVAEDLRPRGLGLKVFDGYRPVRATLAMVAWCERTGRTDLLDDGYIARRSRHNQGVAVDLTLIDLQTGEELDMGTPWDTFAEAAHTARASGAVAERRRLLVEAMAARGFVNYENEWWHFSLAVPDPVPFDLPLEGW
ncbi:MAG: peptidase M15 [Gemmatimonadetes bacterium]|nr:peptidase M15 [Gemmatimonadota bacterium]MCB9505789.1 peptidase M15 [Gemmatimonadales bacterium]MCA9763291.1 peptidase M15 [Gemmatimonadota bacterium]MCA9768268.1 peptidase M15 [Gemmatimonadota bacterium]MCB9517937.1 peptidase M15 [Gemmatimonadales bacterium]